MRFQCAAIAHYYIREVVEHMPAPLWFVKLRALFNRSFKGVTEQLSADASAQERANRKVKLRQLEDRVLMSASPAGAEAAAMPEADQAQQQTTSSEESAGSGDNQEFVLASQSRGESARVGAEEEQSRSSQADASTIVAAPGAEASEEARHELIFVDTGTEDYRQMVDDLLGNADETRVLEVVLLDHEADGIQQITETLKNHGELDAVHIVSHGDDGQVTLGNVTLSANNLDGYAGAIAGWSRHFPTTPTCCFMAVTPRAALTAKRWFNHSVR